MSEKRAIPSQTKSILLTFDVEDWFQVENFKRYIPFSTWADRELRVEMNTHRLLDLLDSIQTESNGNAIDTFGTKEYVRAPGARNPTFPVNSSEVPGPSAIAGSSVSDEMVPGMPVKRNEHSRRGNPRATFFVLGWIARRVPQLVREIHARGHEVASHGYNHHLSVDEVPDVLKRDLTDSKKLLEDILGVSVYGYRAPSFSVNGDIVRMIEACGYLYDSSFNSFGAHDRYGKLDLSRNPRYEIMSRISHGFYELPISNLKLSRVTLPWGGGGYFRLIPLSVFKMGVRAILKKQNAFLFYLHPWEVDPRQPRVAETSGSFSFRHYTNLGKTQEKLRSFLQSFIECQFYTCYHYVRCHENILDDL